MELVWLIAGLLAGLWAAVRVAQHERDQAWRAWVRDPHRHLAPDGRDFWGRAAGERRRRFEAMED